MVYRNNLKKRKEYMIGSPKSKGGKQRGSIRIEYIYFLRQWYLYTENIYNFLRVAYFWNVTKLKNFKFSTMPPFINSFANDCIRGKGNIEL